MGENNPTTTLMEHYKRSPNIFAIVIKALTVIKEGEQTASEESPILTIGFAIPVLPR
jgi:hypothetical protein